jgi:hypothetical protein
MEKDFHYYGTYVAACLAGYPKTESQVIAHAAQYVDDSVRARVLKQGEYGIDFRPITTSHSINHLVKVALAENLLAVRAGAALTLLSGKDFGKIYRRFLRIQNVLRRTWLPFHFLPGNYKSHVLPDPNAESRMVEYTGDKTNLLWKYDDHAKRQFKLLCLSHSPLAIEMINQVNDYKGEQFEHHLAGIRMHVLADTGAHMYYAGTPAWHLNDVGSDVYDKTGHPGKKIKYNYLYNKKGHETFVPEIGLLQYEFVQYLGHGRMGHIPDYPWIKYAYTPRWSSGPIEKDNPKDYLRTFKGMIIALSCINSGKRWNVHDIDTGESLDRNLYGIDSMQESYISEIKTILETKHVFGNNTETLKGRCDLWIKAIRDQKFGKNVLEPDKYDPNAWLNDVKKPGQEIKDTEYYKFNMAAKEHLDFVETSLGHEGIPLTIPLPS